MVSVSGMKTTGKEIASDFSEKNVTFMAAGIAYNAFVSLAPILLLLLLLVNIVGGGLEDRIVEIAQNSLPSPIANVILQVFQGGSTATGASFIGLIVLVWGSLKIFRGLDTAFSEIYETEAANSFTDQLKDGFIVFNGLVFAGLATVVVSTIFAAFSGVVPFLGVLTPLVLIAGLTLAFFPMYYLFPDVDLDWKRVLPGTVFAAVGWAVLQGLFQIYLTFKGGGSTSLFSGVIVVITWLYFSGLVLLLGAVINSVIGGYSSGATGGIGRGASSRSTERKEALNRDELADYLRGLREQLTGRYEGMQSASSDDTDKHPRPDGDTELVEYLSINDDEQEWTVMLRWRAPADESDGRSNSTDD